MLTATKSENDGRQWYVVDGEHYGTGCTFENEEYARSEDGIIDCDGYPLTSGDYEYIAVNSVLPK